MMNTIREAVNNDEVVPAALTDAENPGADRKIHFQNPPRNSRVEF